MLKRHWLWLGAGLVLVSGTLVYQLAAQQVAAPTTPVRPSAVRNIAVVDIEYIFKNHLRFKQEMSALRSEAAAVEQWAQQEQESLKALAEQLKDHQPGSSTYNQIDDTLVKRQKDFEAEVIKKRKEFLLREAKLHYATYQEIVNEIQYLAAANGIVMVLRFNGQEVDPNSPDDVLRYINQLIVYKAPELDLTPIVLQRLNARAQSATTSASTNSLPVVPSQGGYPRTTTPGTLR
ncbi:OmpH family outer membrane protein [Thermogutta sp.]|jgi:Skp family chaperone for outer membrane proteins|uniref:OmpH family outer membrane protein n=1 Tax=Thermogutta sp. TaxID=1962930 RepID=UPI003C7ED5B6